MTMLSYNKFSKKPDSKTGFLLTNGEKIFTESVYLVSPRYIHKRSPAFSLVNGNGRHITGLFPGCNGCLTGDHEGRGILVFIRAGGLAFDLFVSDDLPPNQLRALVCSGQLNEQLLKARDAA